MLHRLFARAIPGSLFLAALAVGVALAAGFAHPAAGTYSTSPKVGRGLGPGIVLVVARKGPRSYLDAAYLQCFVDANSLGAVQATGGTIRISSSGRFAYHGRAAILRNGVLAGRGRLNLTGRFVSARKALGRVGYRTAIKLGGCPGSGSKFVVVGR